MEDAAAEMTAEISAWAASVEKGSAPDTMKALFEAAAGRGAVVLVLKGDLVFGLDHLRSAYYHAARAMAERRNAADSIQMETLLYASGERQLSSAIKKMSPDDQTSEIVIAHLSGPRPEIDNAWTALPQVRPSLSADMYKRFGISQRQIETTRGDPSELVLEMVAAVDILKK